MSRTIIKSLFSNYLKLFIGINRQVWYRLGANFCANFKTSVFAFLTIKLSLLGMSYYLISIAIFIYAIWQYIV